MKIIMGSHLTNAAKLSSDWGPPLFKHHTNVTEPNSGAINPPPLMIHKATDHENFVANPEIVFLDDCRSNKIRFTEMVNLMNVRVQTRPRTSCG